MMAELISKIGVLTSGGDAPGMNAAIRAVVRSGIAKGVEVFGFYHGFQGMIGGEYRPMDSQSVGGILSQGGTVLHTARSMEFKTATGRKQAHQHVVESGVQGLIVIGGDGSLAGAQVFAEEHRVPVVGIPATIDNDIPGTEFSIGFDTAVNTGVEAIDKIRDTAYSHERVFVIEVMGRNNGFIALEVALSCGAEACLIPEIPYRLELVCDRLRDMRRKGKRSSIIVVAEGAAKAEDVQKFIADHTGFEVRYTVLGHMQRGGRPTAFDRMLALRLGVAATERLVAGYSGEMVGMDAGKIVSHPLGYVLGTERTIEPEKLRLVDVMAQ